MWAPYASEDDHRQLYLCFFTLFIRAICARNCLPRDGQIYHNTEQGKNKLCRAKIIIITNFFGMHFYKCRKCMKTIPSSFKNLFPQYLTFRLLGAPPKILFDYHLHFGSLSREHN